MQKIVQRRPDIETPSETETDSPAADFVASAIIATATDSKRPLTKRVFYTLILIIILLTLIFCERFITEIWSAEASNVLPAGTEVLAAD